MPRKVPAGYVNMAHYFAARRLKQRYAKFNTGNERHDKNKKPLRKIPKQIKKSNRPASLTRTDVELSKVVTGTKKIQSVTKKIQSELLGSPSSKKSKWSIPGLQLTEGLEQDMQGRDADAGQESRETPPKKKSKKETRLERSQKRAEEVEQFSKRTESWAKDKIKEVEDWERARVDEVNAKMEKLASKVQDRMDRIEEKAVRMAKDIEERAARRAKDIEEFAAERAAKIEDRADLRAKDIEEFAAERAAKIEDMADLRAKDIIKEADRIAKDIVKEASERADKRDRMAMSQGRKAPMDLNVEQEGAELEAGVSRLCGRIQELHQHLQASKANDSGITSPLPLLPEVTVVRKLVLLQRVQHDLASLFGMLGDVPHYSALLSEQQADMTFLDYLSQPSTVLHPQHSAFVTTARLSKDSGRQQ